MSKSISAYVITAKQVDGSPVHGFVPVYVRNLNDAVFEAFDLYMKWTMGGTPLPLVSNMSACRQSVKDNRCGVIKFPAYDLVVYVEEITIK